jgi:hypothetical protein
MASAGVFEEHQLQAATTPKKGNNQTTIVNANGLPFLWNMVGRVENGSQDLNMKAAGGKSV